MDLKGILKTIKLNENTISMILGALIVVIVGILVINYFRGLRNSSETSYQITSEAAKTEKSNNENPQAHTVAKGETLWSIAQNTYGSGYNWVDIAKANKLKNADHLLVGQSLTLPQVEAKTAQAEKASPATVTTQADKQSLSTNKTNTISSDTYTVVKGDHLWSIAVRAYGDGYQWTKIAKANKLTNPNLIFAGNTLTLPRGQ